MAQSRIIIGLLACLVFNVYASDSTDGEPHRLKRQISLSHATALAIGSGSAHAHAKASGGGVAHANAQSNNGGFSNAKATSTDGGVADAKAIANGGGSADAKATSTGGGIADAEATSTGGGSADAKATATGSGIADAKATSTGGGIADAEAKANSGETAEANANVDGGFKFGPQFGGNSGFSHGARASPGTSQSIGAYGHNFGRYQGSSNGAGASLETSQGFGGYGSKFGRNQGASNGAGASLGASQGTGRYTPSFNGNSGFTHGAGASVGTSQDFGNHHYHFDGNRGSSFHGNSRHGNSDENWGSSHRTGESFGSSYGSKGSVGGSAERGTVVGSIVSAVDKAYNRVNNHFERKINAVKGIVHGLGLGHAGVSEEKGLQANKGSFDYHNVAGADGSYPSGENTRLDNSHLGVYGGVRVPRPDNDNFGAVFGQSNINKFNGNVDRNGNTGYYGHNAGGGAYNGEKSNAFGSLNSNRWSLNQNNDYYSTSDNHRVGLGLNGQYGGEISNDNQREFGDGQGTGQTFANVDRNSALASGSVNAGAYGSASIMSSAGSGPDGKGWAKTDINIGRHVRAAGFGGNANVQNVGVNGVYGQLETHPGTGFIYEADRRKVSGLNSGHNNPKTYPIPSPSGNGRVRSGNNNGQSGSGSWRGNNRGFGGQENKAQSSVNRDHNGVSASSFASAGPHGSATATAFARDGPDSQAWATANVNNHRYARSAGFGEASRNGIRQTVGVNGVYGQLETHPGTGFIYEADRRKVNGLNSVPTYPVTYPSRTPNVSPNRNQYVNQRNDYVFNNNNNSPRGVSVSASAIGNGYAAASANGNGQAYAAASGNGRAEANSFVNGGTAFGSNRAYNGYFNPQHSSFGSGPRYNVEKSGTFNNARGVFTSSSASMGPNGRGTYNMQAGKIY